MSRKNKKCGYHEEIKPCVLIHFFLFVCLFFFHKVLHNFEVKSLISSIKENRNLRHVQVV